MDSLFGNFDKKKKELKNVEVEKKNVVPKELVLQHIEFDVETDNETKDYLLEQTYKIHNTYSKASTNLGKIFMETQDKLASHYGGVFEKWYSALGFAKKSVYRYIDRYRLIESCHSDTTKNLVEALPLTLAYEIAREGTNAELKDKVLSGEIKTFKEYKLALNSILVNKVEEPKLAEVDIEEVLQSDLKVFKSNVKSFEKFIKEELANIEEEKQERIVKEVEEINKRIEKLLRMKSE